MSLGLVLIAIILAALSGMPGLFFARSSAWGQRIAALLMAGAAIVGLAGAFAGMCLDASPPLFFPWFAAGGSMIGLDALSAFFLIPIFLMGGLGSIYGLGYWPQRRHRGNGGKLACFWGLLVAGMGLLVIGRHAMAFLLGWEIMALSAFFLVATEDHREECQRASWVYLAATHVGTLALFGMFVVWRDATGSFILAAVGREAISLGSMNVLFFLGLMGFGLKAGIMPLHFWLPGAHAAAPSHISAMLSGVVLKMGIYGLVRWLSLFPEPPAAWGGTLLVLGCVSGLLGVVFAIAQHDLKRLLAYHSVENIGIILMGLGLAMLGRSHGRPEWIALGLAGALLHTWNHALFKSLLFFCAGAVLHATHSRQIERMGGLAKRMPWTAAMFLAGAVAICGLPPLNGFISELLVYLGLFRTVIDGDPGGSAYVIAAPVLAMIGALAVACFVKVFGAVFLGNARTSAAARAQEAPATMRWPMLVLAGCCALIGLIPILVAPLLDAVIAMWSPLSVPNIGALVPLGTISVLSLSLAAGIAAAVLIAGRSACGQRQSVTWDCGYARPASRMQYSASSFAQMIVIMFNWVLRPQMHRPHLEGIFPRAAKMESHVDDAVLDRVIVPGGLLAERLLGWFHRFQQGITQHYVLYILVTVIVMLSTLIPFKDYFARLFAR